MIDFFRRTTTNTEIDNLVKWYNLPETDYRNKCTSYFIKNFGYPNFFLTKSCTQSLELALLLSGFPPGSEVILPSYAFVSLANAIALRGYTCIFIDCEKDTMNMDASALEQAVSPLTKAVVTLNYGGVACDYDKISAVCKKHNLLLVEDNAHGIRAKYKDEWLGKMGDISTISFDFLKNITCNEGGGICINDTKRLTEFIIAYELGSNKRDFIDGKTPFYEWKGLGSNHTLAEPLAGMLLNQLDQSEAIIDAFVNKWKLYYRLLSPLEETGTIRLAKIPDYSKPNGHVFWIKTAGREERASLISFLKQSNIVSTFHYTPLHLSEFGKRNGIFRGEDLNTSAESSKLLRLPLHYALSEDDITFVSSKIFEFYKVPFRV